MNDGMRGSAGFSLIELLPVIVLTLLIAGALVGLAGPDTRAALAEPDVLNAQEQLRAAASVLARDIAHAGAGVDTGPMTGPLIHYVAPIHPRRLGSRTPDPPDVVKTDTITLLRVPIASPQSTFAADMSGLRVAIADLAGCPDDRPACGFTEGMDAVAFDRWARFSLLTFTAVYDTTGDVRIRGTGPAIAFRRDAMIAGVDGRTYYLDRANRQLRRYDTDVTDAPVADGIARFELTYFGDPLPPTAPRPPAGEENCLYDVVGSARELPILAAIDDGLALLTPEMLVDGPWCGKGETAFDVDLYRVRRVRVTLEAVRPSRSPHAAPLQLTFDVAPRNLRRAP